jgi:hypothetical protein
MLRWLEANMPLLTVYDLHDDHQRIRWMQEATMTTRDLGLVPTHGLFGSAGWWRNIETGNLPSFRQTGLITNVYDFGEADYPEFAVVDENGIESNWKREVNQSEDDDLYIVGRRVELDYVHQRARIDLRDLGIDQTEKCLLSVRIDVPRTRAYRSGHTGCCWTSTANARPPGLQ